MRQEFNIRVYGLLIRDGHLLVSDEVYMGRYMTKFPGGGLEHGEGLEDCLMREWAEELQREVRVGELLFVNPYLLMSSFFSGRQVITFYYLVEGDAPGDFPVTADKYVFPEDVEDGEFFRWLPLAQLAPEHFTYQTDQDAARALMARLPARG